MLEKCDPLAYKKLYDKYINIILKDYSECSKEEVVKVISNKGKSDDTASEDLKKRNREIYDYFARYFYNEEGIMLFDLCAEKFGNKIWCKDKVPKNCKDICPLGEECDEYTVTVDGKRFCYGQLYYRGIKTVKDLFDLADSKDVKIYGQGGWLFADLTRMNPDDEQGASWWMDDCYSDRVAGYGHLLIDVKKNIVYGEKFISEL